MGGVGQGPLPQISVVDCQIYQLKMEFEFQINNNFLSANYMGHTYTKEVSIHLKCTINCLSYILSGIPIWKPGNHGNIHVRDSQL